MNRNDLFDFATELRLEQNAANNLWAWLPSNRILGSHKLGGAPRMVAVLNEAAMLLSDLRGYPVSNSEWAKAIYATIGFAPTEKEIDLAVQESKRKRDP